MTHSTPQRLRQKLKMPPRPKSATAKLKAWAMKRLSRILWVSGAVATLSAGLVGGVKAWPIIEPLWYSSHGWVRSEVHEPLLQRVIKIQLKQSDDERKKLLRDAQKYELELQSDQAKATPQYHALVQKEIERVKNELDENDAKQKSLFNEKISK